MEIHLLGDDWTAVGHSVGWEELIPLGFGLLALAALAVLFVRAIIVRRRYRALGMLSKENIQALREQVASLERETTGEVAIVVLEESDAHPQGCLLAAIVGMVAAATVASADPRAAQASILVPALALGGAAGYFTARWLPHFRRRFVSTRRADEMVEEQALQEFSRLGMHRTEGRTGVLILISLFERAVIVLADEGVHVKGGAEAWVDANRRILEGVRNGSLAKGLRDGIESVGQVLRVHCPRGQRLENELPDHIVIRRR